MRSILVTGASSGIGLDASRTLAIRGWRVLATVRRPEDAARLAELGLEPLMLDLASEASVAAVAAEAIERTGGRLDALFNNAAFATPGAVEDLPRAALREIFETNLFGQIDLTNRVLPAMRRAGAGRVVMNSSVLGLVAAPWRGAYVATKFALEGITDAERIRDLIMERARRSKSAGLGDESAHATPTAGPGWTPAHLDALREILAAARRLSPRA